MIGTVVDLAAARLDRRPPERDTVCRDCGRVLDGLVRLADHYAHNCKSRPS
jgi:hypothetical protein